jgi:hypothetical protein
MIVFVSRFIVVICVTFGCFSCSEPQEPTRENREIGQTIIDALAAYRTDNGHVPDELAKLVPDYLPEAPRTLRGREFRYIIDKKNSDHYYLGFFLDEREVGGCSYIDEFSFWDCTTDRLPE